MEHSRAAYRADFALYAALVVVVTAFLLAGGRRAHWLERASFVLAGLGSWTAIEYASHRFALHGLQPFRRWHTAHHARPTALLCTPTLMSAALIVVLVFLPALALGSLMRAFALTLGVAGGCLGCSITHHAVHHWRADSEWLRKRKRWHALHRHHAEDPGCYGAAGAFWDRLLGSAVVPGAVSLPR